MNKKTVSILILLGLAIALGVIACAPNQTAQDIQRDRQEDLLKDGAAQVGMPSIKNFREAKLAKDIYELRDQTGLITYTYLYSDLQGKLILLCESVGYPIPYSVQFTSPEAMQTYNVTRNNSSSNDGSRYYGVQLLPQAEPNSLFTPASAEGTWVMCKDPGGKDVRPVYIEPRVVVSQFKLQ